MARTAKGRSRGLESDSIGRSSPDIPFCGAKARFEDGEPGPDEASNGRLLERLDFGRRAA